MLSRTDLYFLTIAKTGNLNKAAQQLYVSQPALSKYIQRLEAQLGAPLFDHESSPLQLNESGKLYLQYLQNAIEQESQLLTKIGEINQMVRGTLRMGIAYYCGQCYLPRVLPAFTAEFPHVTVDVLENMGVDLENAIVNQEIDAATTYLPVHSEYLTYRPLVRERILLAVRRAPDDPHVSTESRIIVQNGDLEVFRGKPVIMPRTRQKIGARVSAFFSHIDYMPPIYTHVQNTYTSLSLTAEGMGISFAPESGLDSIAGKILERLSFYAFPGELSDWQLAAVYRKNTTPNVFTARFFELVEQTGRSFRRSIDV